MTAPLPPIPLRGRCVGMPGGEPITRAGQVKRAALYAEMETPEPAAGAPTLPCMVCGDNVHVFALANHAQLAHGADPATLLTPGKNGGLWSLQAYYGQAFPTMDQVDRAIVANLKPDVRHGGAAGGVKGDEVLRAGFKPVDQATPQDVLDWDALRPPRASAKALCPVVPDFGPDPEVWDLWLMKFGVWTSLHVFDVDHQHRVCEAAIALAEQGRRMAALAGSLGEATFLAQEAHP